MPLARTRLLKKVNAIEMSDLGIKDKEGFFKYYLPTG